MIIFREAKLQIYILIIIFILLNTKINHSLQYLMGTSFCNFICCLQPSMSNNRQVDRSPLIVNDTLQPEPVIQLQIQVQIKLNDGRTRPAIFYDNLNGLQLKQYIQQVLESKLKVQEMYIYHDGEQIKNDITLQQLMNGQQKIIMIVQKGIPQERNVQFLLINNQSMNCKLYDDLSVRAIKKYIFKNLSPELASGDMCLYYDNKTKLMDSIHLGQINMDKSKPIKIVQRKLEVSDYPESYLKIHPTVQDPQTWEEGVVEMKCGCFKGQQAMFIMMKALVKESKTVITCSKHPNIEWDWNICKKVARLTLTQRIQLQSGFSTNFATNNTHTNALCICPNQQCKTTIEIEDLTLIKIKCPTCRQNFCLKCKNKWLTGAKNTVICGNQQCVQTEKFVNQQLKNCPDKNMPLKYKDKLRNYKVPTLRSCIFCRTLIEHTVACKHMTCKLCQNKFCFVCLKKFEGGKWPCGSFKDYCGSVHPRQKL